jgi:hypothetical protein
LLSYLDYLVLHPSPPVEVCVFDLNRMPGGGSLLNGRGMTDYGYGGALTVPVVVTCLMAASGGLIFGYDIGISGASPFPSPPVWFSCLGFGFRCTFLARSSFWSSGVVSESSATRPDPLAP